jgi:hypothetical protein
MNLRLYKTLFGRLGTVISNSSTRQNLIRIGRIEVNWDSRRRYLNPQGLRIMGKSLR